VSLQDWLKNGWLIEHQTSHQEIADLLGMADRDLTQCRTPHLSPDWQLNIAYSAALQAATAALAAAGYRAARDTHHYRVIQSLAYTIKADERLITQLDKFRKKRNISGYERAGAVSEQEAKEIFALAENLRNKVEKWLRSNYPRLL
jgi:HEPN domain-containing protein